MICPVTILASLETKKFTIPDTSDASHIFFKGCFSLMFSSIRSFRKIPFAKSVLVRVGAIQFTLTLGANSAARDFVSPSIPAFAVEIEE